MTWQQIDTAPKDGSYVLLNTEESMLPVIAQWIFWNGKFAWRDEHEEPFYAPTHWWDFGGGRAMPEPPTTPRLERERMEGETE